ncbi:hypothetical protein SAMN05661008_01540 [Alkalithermobacter thermoalcaliphilus JW-YL-7 = DSM 7308]|uniref:Uncharacterized protein n=1 Tax=Alkalithermobacter thermoalcaliphilus JW-YL-7 = DSM 7308 TaxID=1121328 RepID=A0A150FSJ2_CLOPD|nr:hypothetical protein JWYL7_1075 [[Clostridium] paradoxum JW-YL-7 = DSM 7308]SHL14035.1 hypothetical protein SAMN05661008_01540 [[Clostridium] paradoxum JW-YL-7 = DSM 7308]
MKGTAKQIKWAEDIKKEMEKIINKLEEVKEEVIAKKNAENPEKDYTNSINKKIEKIKNLLENDDSTFFINNFKEITEAEKEIQKIEKIYEENKEKIENDFELSIEYKYRKKEMILKKLEAFKQGCFDNGIVLGQLYSTLKEKEV